LEFFLRQREEAELRRRELLHKHWTEHVWFPLDKRVKEHVSRCGPVEPERRQNLYSHYLRHCDSKVRLPSGFLAWEYNPFLLNVKKPHYLKVGFTVNKKIPPRVSQMGRLALIHALVSLQLKTDNMKDTSYRHLLKEKRTSQSCEAGI